MGRADVEKEELEKQESRPDVKLTELFKRVDHDDNQRLTRTEFTRLITEKSYLLELQDASNLDSETLRDLFDYLAESPDPKLSDAREPAGDPVISQDRFIKGLRNERKEVHERSIMSLEKRIHVMEAVS